MDKNKATEILGGTGCLLLILVPIAIMVYRATVSGNDNHPSKSEEFGEYQAVEVAQESGIKEMALKYNAIVEWERHFTGGNAISTLQIQRLLSGENDRAVLFHGHLTDVWQHNDQYWTSFCTSSLEMPGYYGKINWNLQCSPAQAEKLSDKLTSFIAYADFLERFVVVARIDEILKREVKSGGEEDNPKSILINGRLLDYCHLENFVIFNRNKMHK